MLVYIPYMDPMGMAIIRAELRGFAGDGLIHVFQEDLDFIAQAQCFIRFITLGTSVHLYVPRPFFKENQLVNPLRPTACCVPIFVR